MVILIEKLQKEVGKSRHLVDNYIKKKIDDNFYQNYRDEILYASHISSDLYEKVFLSKIISKSVNLPFEKIKYFAIASELLMVGALTGDDILDNGYARGNSPTLFVKYGLEKAQLISNIILGFFNSAICEGQNQSCKNSLKVSKLYFNAYNSVFIGQYHLADLEGKHDTTPKEIDKLALNRVGILFAATCAAPIIIAEYDQVTIMKYYNYGKYIGMAIQLRDDILDYIGEEDIMGKPQFADILNSQPNLVTSYLINSIKDDKKMMRIFNKYWGVYRNENTQKVNKSEFEEEMLILLETGNIIDKAIQHLNSICEKAKNELDNIIENKELIIFCDLISNFE